MKDYSRITFILGMVLLVAGLWEWRIFALGAMLTYLGWDCIGWGHMLHQFYTRDASPESKLSYRIVQHGLMIPVLYIGYTLDYRAVIIPIVVWLTAGLDIAFHWVVRVSLPRYFDYLYWSGPAGWALYLYNRVNAREVRIPLWVLLSQALVGVGLAVYVAW